MTTAKCAACGAPASGAYFIHQDGLGVGPEVPLCEGCGAHEEPSCEELWSRIAALAIMVGEET